MARKVFLTMLGAGFYGKGCYVDDRTGFESSPTRYIQEATLKFVDAGHWSADDSIIVALTKDARQKNWCVSGNKRLNPLTKQEEEYIGLKDSLLSLNGFVSITELSIPDGKDEKEMWQIFTCIYDSLNYDDELYIDLTHSFRYLPMLLLVLVDYARFLKNVTVKSLTYGNWEARDIASNRAPIIDLLSLIALQNWTSASIELVNNGNAKALCCVTGKELKDLLRENDCASDIRALNNASKNLEQWVDQIRTCRGLEIINGGKLRTSLAQLDKTNKDSFPPLMPILEKIKKSFSDSGFDVKDDNLDNAYAAVKWCVTMNLWQSAITILQEAIITRLCSLANLDFKTIPNRKLVGSARNRIAENKPLEQWEIKEEDRDNFNIIRTLPLLSTKSFIDLYCQISELRNDLNHSGMRTSHKDERRIVADIKKKIEEVAEIFNIESSSLACVKKERIFINFSNHPITQWSEQQLLAAREYGNLEDEPFPNIGADVDKDDISRIVQEYADIFYEKSRNAELSIHIMGEMTFTYELINQLKLFGIRCLASTSIRSAVDNEDGTKTSMFKFVRFREY